MGGPSSTDADLEEVQLCLIFGATEPPAASTVDPVRAPPSLTANPPPSRPLVASELVDRSHNIHRSWNLKIIIFELFLFLSISTELCHYKRLDTVFTSRLITTFQYPHFMHIIQLRIIFNLGEESIYFSQ